MLHVRFAVLLFLLQACAAAPARPDSIDPLVGSWQLAAAVPPGARIPTLTIGRDGAANGNSGVNRFAARIDVTAVTAGAFHLDLGASTTMAGSQEAMQLEAAFLQALAAADAVVVSRDTMALHRGGRPLLEFRRVTGR